MLIIYLFILVFGLINVYSIKSTTFSPIRILNTIYLQNYAFHLYFTNFTLCF